MNIENCDGNLVKARTFVCGRTNTDMVRELNVRGRATGNDALRVSPTVYSRIIGGMYGADRSRKVLTAAREILDDWEREMKGGE